MNVYSTSGSQENCQRFHWQRRVSKNLAIIEKMACCMERSLKFAEVSVGTFGTMKIHVQISRLDNRRTEAFETSFENVFIG
ncbi:hypothetical protein Celaphus_00014276, partial [Cervus elaphus hippelaphus]